MSRPVIELREISRKVRFGDLSIGDTFIHESDLFIKSFSIGVGYRAVSLHDGCIVGIVDSKMVEPVDIRITKA